MKSNNNFVKILENDDGELIENTGVIIHNLCDTTRSLFDEIIKEKEIELVSCMVGCESPIEQIMALRLNEYRESYNAVRNRMCNGIDIVEIYTQFTMNIKGKNYRPDFLIAIHDTCSKEYFSFVIECDGHDFHEKTKEQAQRDKKRDRDILSSGMHVMRYTGSEIHNNSGIAYEIFESIKSIIENRRKQRR